MQGDKSQLLYLKDNSNKYHFCVYVYAASVQNNAAGEGERGWEGTSAVFVLV